jgi:hypothetical protein
MGGRTMVVRSCNLGLLAACSALLGASACTSGSESDTSAAAVVIHMAAADVGSSDLLARVQDLVLMEDTIWVLNSTEPYFLAFDSRARFVRAWGSQGGGPLEFSGPIALLGDSERGITWTYDAPRHRIRPITSRGELPADRPVPHESEFHLVSLDHVGMGPGRPWMALVPSGLLTASAPVEIRGTARLWQALITHSVEGVPVDTVVRIADLVAAPGRISGGRFMGPHPLWTACPDASIVFYNPVGNGLWRIGPDGSRPVSVTLPRERRHRVSVERLARLIYQREAELVTSHERPDSAEFVRAIELELATLGNQVSDVFPEYADLHCTSRSVWMQRFDPTSRLMGRGPSWLQIDLQGVVQEMEFPENFSPLRFADETVWGVVRDQLDVVSIAAVRLPR